MNDSAPAVPLGRLMKSGQGPKPQGHGQPPTLLPKASTPAETLDTEQLRYILWIAHGHDGLYGDDGEMQCSQCGSDWDYLRGSLPQLVERAYSALALARLSRNEEPDHD